MAGGTPGWRRARRPSTREASREALIDTALALFAERGYVGVRVEDIATAAGLSRATFYKHFSERDEILAELFRRLLGDEPTPLDTSAPVASEVQRALAVTVRRLLEQPQLARFVYTLPIRHAAVVGPERATPPVFESIAALVTAGVTRGEVRGDVAVSIVVEALRGAFESAMRDWAEGRAPDAVERLHTSIDLVMHGALPRDARR